MTDPAVLRLVEQWREDNRVIHRKYTDAGVAWLTAADQLEAALALSVDPPRQEYGCINCGEAHDGGYVSGWEGHINEGAVGPFCSQCWEFLRETFRNEAALALSVDPPPLAPEDVGAEQKDPDR